jgi:hypothetical protein
MRKNLYEGMPEGAELARIQAGISATMSAVVADRYHPSFSQGPAATVKVAGAGVAREPYVDPRLGRGWQREVPLVSPLPNGSFAERVVGAMCDQVLGPVQSPLETMKAQLRAMTAEQRAETLKAVEGRKGQPFYLEVRALFDEVGAGAV